jgi:Protein of unknown function (DUF2637)
LRSWQTSRVLSTAYALVRAHGEAGWTGRLVPLTVDGLIYASSMVMLDSAHRKVPVPALARWLLGLGIAATLAANVAHGLGHGPVSAAVAAWPAVALAGSCELFMMVICSSQAAPHALSDGAGIPDPLQEQAAEVFAPQTDRVVAIPDSVWEMSGELTDRTYVVSIEFTDAAENHWERDARGALVPRS